MIRAYLAMWRAEGDPLDLAKARQLANSITRVQLDSGRVPTFWTHNWLGSETYDWFNCMESSMMVLLEIDGVIETAGFRGTSGPVQKTFERVVGTGTIAGIAGALSDEDYHVSFQCAGYADVEKKVPMSPDTLCAIWSMTKTFAGVCILCAIDDGKISLDDHLSKHLPEFADVKMRDGSKPKREITIRDCMCHSTGCHDGGWPQYETVRDVARKFAKVPLDAQPGETFSYGNQWVDTALAALEVAVGEKWEDYLKTRVLDPLGMKDTIFFPDAEQITRLAKMYTSDAYPFRPLLDLDKGNLERAKAGKAMEAHAFGGLYSTARDVIQFSQMLAHHGSWKAKTIVSRETFDKYMLRKQTAESVREPYSVGAWLWGDWIGHEGANRTAEWANPKTGHARVFMIQTWNQGGPAFFHLKAVWHDACDREQGVPTTIFGT